MFKTYARVESGIVQEIITPELFDDEGPFWTEGDSSRIGLEKPIEIRFPSWFVETLHDITNLDPSPQYRWTFDGTTFSAPVPYQPSPEEIQAANETQRSALMTQASQAMAPILVSLQLGDATDDETVKARAWQAYYRALQVVDVSVATPGWPLAPAV
ncbi:tail fiber assembly protein [Pseudomonas sp. LB1P83]